MIEIFTDGGCVKEDIYDSRGAGSCAFVIIEDGQIIHEGAEFYDDTTNNRMELNAAISALYKLTFPEYREKEIVLYSDSQYLIKGVNEWGIGWKRNRWLKKGKPMLNAEYWITLDHCKGYFKNITFTWVRGHADNMWNNYVDNLCTKAIAKRLV